MSDAPVKFNDIPLEEFKPGGKYCHCYMRTVCYRMRTVSYRMRTVCYRKETAVSVFNVACLFSPSTILLLPTTPTLTAKFDVIRTGKEHYTEGTVLSVDFSTSVKKVYFRFKGMQDKWNEWVEAESTRIAPHQAYTRVVFVTEKKAKARNNKKRLPVISRESNDGKGSSPASRETNPGTSLTNAGPSHAGPSYSDSSDPNSSHPDAPKASPSNLPRKRRNLRCGACEGCMRKDCGKCKHCLGEWTFPKVCFPNVMFPLIKLTR